VNLEEDTGEMIISHYQEAFVGVFRELADKYKAVYPTKKVLLAKENLLPTGKDITDHSVFVQENDIVFAVVPHVRDYVFKPIDLLGAVYGSGAEDHVGFEHWVNGLYHIFKDTRATIVVGTVRHKEVALKSSAYRILHTGEFGRHYSTFGPNGGGKQAALSLSGNNIRQENPFGWVTGILSQAPGPNWDIPSTGSLSDSPLINGPLPSILSWSFADMPGSNQQNATAPPPPAERALAWSPLRIWYPQFGQPAGTFANNPSNNQQSSTAPPPPASAWSQSQPSQPLSPTASVLNEGFPSDFDFSPFAANYQVTPSATPAAQPAGSVSGAEALGILSSNIHGAPTDHLNIIRLRPLTFPSWFHASAVSNEQASSSPASAPASAPQQQASTAGVERTWSMAEYEQAMQQEPTIQQPPVRRSERLRSQLQRVSQAASASRPAAPTASSSARQTIPQDDVNEEEEEEEEPMSAPATRKSTRRHQDEPDFKRPRRE
jgi:hypothetical protein